MLRCWCGCLQPTFKDIRAKNAQFAASARENAGKPRIRASKENVEADGDESLEAKKQTQRRGRNIVKPAKKDRTPPSALKNNRVALALICFVVIGGGKFTGRSRPHWQRTRRTRARGSKLTNIVSCLAMRHRQSFLNSCDCFYRRRPLHCNDGSGDATKDRG